MLTLCTILKIVGMKNVCEGVRQLWFVYCNQHCCSSGLDVVNPIGCLSLVDSMLWGSSWHSILIFYVDIVLIATVNFLSLSSVYKKSNNEGSESRISILNLFQYFFRTFIFRCQLQIKVRSRFFCHLSLSLSWVATFFPLSLNVEHDEEEEEKEEDAAVSWHGKAALFAFRQYSFSFLRIWKQTKSYACNKNPMARCKLRVLFDVCGEETSNEERASLMFVRFISKRLFCYEKKLLLICLLFLMLSATMIDDLFNRTPHQILLR